MRDVAGLPWLTFNIFSMPGLVLVTVTHTFPFVYLLAASALQSVDASYEEAAQILGAGKLRTALAITAPLVAPAVLSGTLLGFVNAIALFGSQAIIGLPGRIVTLPTRIYALFDYPPEYGLASALSLVFVLITIVALYLQRAFLARRSYVTLAGKGSRLELVRLGKMRFAVLGFGILVFIVAILAPFSTLIAVSLSKSWGLDFWKGLTLANYKFILFDYDVTRRAILNSLMLATLAATAAVLLGAVIGWIDLRTRIPGRRLLDYFALIPLGLPGIVMAVALIQFWLAMPVALYGTLAILLLAYVGRYIPLGVRAANAALRQIDPSLEESAQILGASWLTTMREVTLPLIRPGLFAGWLLVFVPVIQELSASILLFSSSSITTAVAIYNLYETGYIEPVAALAMINMFIIGAAIWLATQIGGSRILGRGGDAAPEVAHGAGA
jgi:iron(III) transport system permease protein